MPIGPHRVGDENANEKDFDRGKTIIFPRGFDITWGNDDRYWQIADSNEPKDSCVAELKQVSWLEVTCSTDNVKVGETYKVGFKVSLRPDAFGWNGTDVYVMAKVGKSGKFIPMKVSLGDKEPNSEMIIPEKSLKITVDDSTPEEQMTIHLGLYEVWSSKWKGGLKIHQAFIEKVVDP